MFKQNGISYTDKKVIFPSWGRCFWQDPNDGTLVIAFGEIGNDAVVGGVDSKIRIYYSTDNGESWSDMLTGLGGGNVFVDNLTIHDNFDTLMTRDGYFHLLVRDDALGSSLAHYYVYQKLGTGSYQLWGGQYLTGVFDSGNVGGLNGSLFEDVSGPASGVASDSPNDWPAIRVVLKDANNDIRAYWGEKNNTNYLPLMGDADGIGKEIFEVMRRNAGLDGGFPIMYRYTDGFTQDGMPAVVYYCEPTGTLEMCVKKGPFDGAFQNRWTPNGAGILTANRDINAPVLSGIAPLSGLAPPGPMMAFGSGLGGSQVFIGNTRNLQTLYSTQSKRILGSPYDEFIIEPAIADNIRVGADPCPFGSGDRSFALNKTIYGIHGSTQAPHVATSGGNTRCDFTITDDADEIKFYFQDIDDVTGHQVIKRVVATQRAQQSGNPPQWQFTPKNHPESGIKNIARVNPIFTGGSGIACWTHFKALKHPTEPGDGSAKNEMLALVGHTPTATDGLGGSGWLPGTIAFYDVSKDSVVNSNLPYPYFSMDYTKTSGNPVGLVDVTASGWEDSDHLFDGNLGTYAPQSGSLSGNPSVTIEFSKPLMIDRIEMLKPSVVESGFTGPVNLPSFEVDTSFDGINFTSHKQDIVMLTNFSSVNLIKTHPTHTSSIDPTVTHNIQPIVGKYIRIRKSDYAVSFEAPMQELRLYGPAQSQGEIITAGDSSATLIFTGPLEQYNTEKFHARHGELPAEFHTYGDFHWYTSASGDWSKAADLPGVIPSSVGTVDSGFFTGDWVGVDDGFAATVPVVPENAGSGVMRALITIAPGEFFNAGAFNGRPIQFDYRLDLHPDDEFEFTTLKAAGTSPPYGQYVTPVSRMLWKGNRLSYGTSPVYALSPGRYILQWEYRRGGTTDSTAAGAAWLDNIRGLDGQPQPSIRGFLRGGTVGTSGAIHGFTHGEDLAFQTIHGYTAGVGMSGVIHGYTNSAVVPDILSNIHGYIESNTQADIYGYLLGSNVLTTTYPTGSIHGFVMVPSGAVGTIHGHVNTMEAKNIYGFLHGYDDANSSIHGFVDSFDITSMIYGLVNGSGDNVVTDSIHGFVQSRFGLGDQVIHGFVDVPSGSTSDRKGYTQGWEQGPNFFRDPQTMVFGILEGYDSTNSTIHSYMSGNGPGSRIHGYAQGEFIQSGNASIHGYVKRPSGLFIDRKGYVLAGDATSQIHGFTLGHEPASGSIHGYLTVPEHSQINGYVFGISGVANESIHGYTSAVEAPYSFINGITLGTFNISVGDDPCPGHNFPLPEDLVVSIPTGNFIN